MTRWLRIAVALVLGAVAGGAGSMALMSPGPEPSGDVTDDPLRPTGPETDDRVVGTAPITTLLAWTPGGLPDGYAGEVEDLPPVRSVTTVRSGTAWLTRWRDSGGTPHAPPPGLAVPVEVAAVTPSTYARFVPPADRAALRALGPGRAVLSRAAAELRDLGEGARLTFGRTVVRVIGIVDDELIGAHELVVDRAQGVALGATRPRYVLIEPVDGARRRALESGLRRLLPPGVRIRVRGPGETPVFRHGDAVLPLLRIKELFGEFAAAPASGGFLRVDPRWVAENIRAVRVPVLGDVRCHRAIIPTLRSALDELVRRGLSDLLEPGDYGGCYAPRFIARSPGAGLSHHAWGIAFDVNVSQNPLGGEPRLDPRVVAVFERHGFTWGGRWLIPDGMHFEFLRFPSGY